MLSDITKICLEVGKSIPKTTVVLAIFQYVEEREHSSILPTAREDQDLTDYSLFCPNSFSFPSTFLTFLGKVPNNEKDLFTRFPPMKCERDVPGLKPILQRKFPDSSVNFSASISSCKRNKWIPPPFIFLTK